MVKIPHLGALKAVEMVSLSVSLLLGTAWTHRIHAFESVKCGFTLIKYLRGPAGKICVIVKN